MATTFTAAMDKHPLRAFQIATFVVCLLVLTCDGMDQQLLGIIAPAVIEAFGVSKAVFGWAISASLVGFGLGAWSGGWLGDAIGRRWSLALAAAVFSLATIAASWSTGVWSLAAWRVIGGLGFGSAYANAMAMSGEWLPDRWRSVAVSTLSVGTPAGGTIVGWVAPPLLAQYGWQGTFVALGAATFLVVLLIIAALRDSPSFLLERGKAGEAQRTAAKLFREDVGLVPETHASEADGGKIGVLHASNARLNMGVGLTFTACALCAYGMLNWGTTFLTAKGFTLAEAGNVVAVGGLTSIASSIAAGLLVQRFGSKATFAGISATLVAAFILTAIAVERLPAAPSANDRLLVLVLYGATAAIFSAGMGAIYSLMTYAYPQSCRSAGIGFGIFMARVGAIGSSLLGGWLLDLGHGSTIPFFTVMTISAAIVSSVAFVNNRHVPPARLRQPASAFPI